MADRGGYHIVILGGGSGGYACALRAAELGKRAALIEKGKVGGTCLHRGYIPTKALLHAAEIADQARESATFGVRSTFDGIDMAGVNAYKDKVVTRLWRGLVGLIGSRHIDIIDGEGRLVSPTQVQVGDSLIEGAHVVLASGSEPRSLPGLEIDGQRVITSDQALELDRVPASVVILGGGVIGVEFASVWRSFGAEVTIVEMLPHLLAAGGGVQLETARARVPAARHRLQARRQVRGREGERLGRHRHAGGRHHDRRRAAARRRRPGPGLGYADTGVAMQRGYVMVDEYCQTSVPTISAVGDLIPGPQLAHVGFAEGIMVAERLGGLPVTPIDYDGVPQVTYSNPEVASVGITSAIAAERGIKTTEVTYDLAGNGKSQILQTAGAAKVIAAEGGGPVLGIHLVGARVGELIAEGQLIYNWEALPSGVAQLIHPHPTQSEIIGEAHLALAGKPLHFHS